MEKLIEAIKNKDIVKAKKIFNGLMEDVKTNLVEEERKIVSSKVMTEDETDGSDEPEDDEEDDDSTDGKVDSSDTSSDDEDKQDS